jgi:hypothetical protein
MTEDRSLSIFMNDHFSLLAVKSVEWLGYTQSTENNIFCDIILMSKSIWYNYEFITQIFVMQTVKGATILVLEFTTATEVKGKM